MNAHVSTIALEDTYLVHKRDRLQAMVHDAFAARQEIPDTASLAEKIEIAQFALAPIRRTAEMFMLYQHRTAVGAVMKARVAACLDGGLIEDVLSPVRT